MPEPHGKNYVAILTRLRRETGLDRTTCQATLDVLLRSGFAQRYVRPEEDALLVLRRVCGDPKYSDLKKKTEAARDGAVVVRARHCLANGNRFECMNEILDAFQTGVLPVGKLLNARVHPSLGSEERDVVIRGMLGSIWLRGMRGGQFLDHLRAYPDDLDPEKSFCLATYAAGIARNAEKSTQTRSRRWRSIEKVWKAYVRNRTAPLTQWLRETGLSVRDAIDGIDLPIGHDTEEDNERKATKLGNTMGKMPWADGGAAPAPPEEELEARELEETTGALLRIITAFAHATLGRRALGVFEHTRRLEVSDEEAAQRLDISVNSLYEHRSQNRRKIELFVRFVIFEQSVKKIAAVWSEPPDAVRCNLRRWRIRRREWAAEARWLRRIQGTYGLLLCLVETKRLS